MTNIVTPLLTFNPQRLGIHLKKDPEINLG
jgi:hypothetical protein